MQSLGKCIDNVPVEGYTQRRTSPSNTNHRERTRKVSTASTAVVRRSIEQPLNSKFPWVHKRAVLSRAVGIYPLAVEGSTDRKKVLQMDTVKTVRAMRAVF